MAIHIFTTIILLAFASAVHADNWVYEFGFGYVFNSSALLDSDCRLAQIVEPWYPESKFRLFSPYPCGGGDVMYTHFLGRKCLSNFIKIKKLELYCGWSHGSFPFNRNGELYYDLAAFRGRVSF